MFECESCGSTSYYGHFCRPCKQQAIQINISMDLKYLIDQLCHAHYQAGVFWAAGLPLKKTNNFIVEENQNKITKLWKNIKKLEEV